jgi:hypothetical protein
MNGSLRALILLLLATPLAAFADQLIPAGSLVQCTVSEPKLSSKTTAVGDPVLCQVSHVELYGRSVFPTGSYLVGRFEDYKDPGHFVGKGWMELKFDHMTLPPDEIISVSAKVVYVPHYPVDRDGRILGNGHAVRDTVEWLIPVLWPIDLINLPRRGPRPILKEETRLTLKIMDDIVVPNTMPTPPDQYGFAQRAPVSYSAPPPPPVAPQPQPQPTAYVAPLPAPARPVATLPPPIVLVLRSGYSLYAARYWYDAGGRIQYIAPNGTRYYIALQQLDFNATIDANRRNGLSFTIPVTVGYPGY